MRNGSNSPGSSLVLLSWSEPEGRDFSISRKEFLGNAAPIGCPEWGIMVYRLEFDQWFPNQLRQLFSFVSMRESGENHPSLAPFAEDPSLIIGCDYTVFRVDGEPESRYGILHGGSRTIKSRDPIGCLFGGTWKSSSATGKES